jgi:hypothetical protein
MSARSLSIADGSVASTAPTILPTPRPDLRYRLIVMASSTVDVVSSAGGWLYDRSMAGCDVTAILTERTNEYALQMLGVQTAAFDDTPTSELCDPESALAVSADLYRTDARTGGGARRTRCRLDEPDHVGRQLAARIR